MSKLNICKTITYSVFLSIIVFVSTFISFDILIAGRATLAPDVRRAVIVANDKYQNFRALQTRNGVRRIKAQLEKIGFQVLPPLRNVDGNALLSELRKISNQWADAGRKSVVLVYLMGYVNISNRQMFYTVDGRSKKPNGVRIQDILNVFRDGPRGAKFIAIDGCGYRAVKSRSISPKKVGSRFDIPPNTFLFVSQGAQSSSYKEQDCASAHRTFVRELKRPRVSLTNALQSAKRNLYKISKGQNLPLTVDRLNYDVRLK
ncbi:MAG: caspase family protein [Methyloligellaceae bacterium]